MIILLAMSFTKFLEVNIQHYSRAHIIVSYITYTRDEFCRIIRDYFQSLSKGCRIIRRAKFLEEVRYCMFCHVPITILNFIQFPFFVCVEQLFFWLAWDRIEQQHHCFVDSCCNYTCTEYCACKEWNTNYSCDCQHTMLYIQFQQ